MVKDIFTADVLLHSIGAVLMTWFMHDVLMVMPYAAAGIATFIWFWRELTQLQCAQYDFNFLKGWNIFKWTVNRNAEWILPGVAAFLFAAYIL